MKLFKLSLLVSFSLFLSLNAASSDESYVFEAKGEFAKELKSLVEKYSKDENVTVNVYENSVPHKDSRFLSTGVDRNIDYTAKEGEKIYKANCLACHGEKGEKRTSATAKRLSKMSGEEIYYSFQAYVSDLSHGGGQRIVMAPIAARISSKELGYIIAYLKGENDFIFKNDDLQNTNIQRNPTNQGTYLK
ncbi:c-type cytochrome [Campylobacter geochelonis]|uniref:c-type cytochrome n=1 Tax=Campylobacter geochelonis TaxID=1780362 RepID=UPI00077087BB|nr:cytochrome c [Campylobacter geochelonis]CZE48506.1 putative cytochrome c family protein [Campylobacter geochelonis]CZE51174.1 putative cytochrome c family protein [Campylobacter geochelonis]